MGFKFCDGIFRLWFINIIMEEVSKGIDAVAYYYELLGVWIPATMGGTKPKKTRKT